MSVDKDGKEEERTRSGAKPQQKFSSHALFKIKERAIVKTHHSNRVLPLQGTRFKVQKLCSIHGIIAANQKKKLKSLKVKSQLLLSSWQLSRDNKILHNVLDRI